MDGNVNGAGAAANAAGGKSQPKAAADRVKTQPKNSKLKGISEDLDRTHRAVSAAKAKVDAARAALSVAENDHAEAVKAHNKAKTAAAEAPRKLLTPSNMDRALTDPRLRKMLFSVLEQIDPNESVGA